VAVKIRLMRMGKTKQPTYRVVVADGRSPRDGRFVEIIGKYNPRTEPSTVEIDNDKAIEWLRKGAQPTDRVVKLLEISGAWAIYQAGRPAKVARPVKVVKTVKATKATKASA
jgi:small subunit ribosomal protein S16